MPAYCYLSDSEIREYSSVPDDLECNDLLQELRNLTKEPWLVQVKSFALNKPWWWVRKKPAPLKIYTLYYLNTTGIEAQIINLCVENSEGGSVFSSSSRSDVMNYMMGHINGISSR